MFNVVKKTFVVFDGNELIADNVVHKINPSWF
jgi:hypothetical protein